MRDEQIMGMWREKLKVPTLLTVEETMRFWTAAGIPYEDKVNAVLRHADRYRLKCLIETGTYRGHMIEAALHHFDRIISIELDAKLAAEAKEKFAVHPKVTIVEGDSGTALGPILRTVTEPCMFWLDGHYVPFADETARGRLDTPILQELDHIFKHRIRNHVILIDDARCFIGPNPVLSHYPTIRKLKAFVAKRRPDLKLEVDNDIMCIKRRD